MKLDLLTNATVVDDAIRFICKNKEGLSDKFHYSVKRNEDGSYVVFRNTKAEIEFWKIQHSKKLVYRTIEVQILPIEDANKLLTASNLALHFITLFFVIISLLCIYIICAVYIHMHIYNMYTFKSMGIDPAYGSSNFGIVITQFSDGMIQVLYADEFPRPDYNEMLGRCIELIEKYNITKVYIDSANPSFIRSLKQILGERSDYEKVIEYYKKIK